MAETGLKQNYLRDYDPLVGRYVESDPIGSKAATQTGLESVNCPVQPPYSPPWQPVTSRSAPARPLFP
jgi:hypothetical protein